MGTAASVKEVSGKAEALGVIPHSIKFIFTAMQQSRSDYDITMKVALLATLAYFLPFAIACHSKWYATFFMPALPDCDTMC